MKFKEIKKYYEKCFLKEKVLALPWKMSVGCRLSNFFLVEILRFAAQILGFTRWHPPKILRSSRQPFSTPFQDFFNYNYYVYVFIFLILLLSGVKFPEYFE